MRARAGRWMAARGGTAAVEFAFVAPLLLMLLIGTLAYGGYFWRAHGL